MRLSRVPPSLLLCHKSGKGEANSQEHTSIWFQDLQIVGMRATLRAKFRTTLMCPFSRLAHDLGEWDGKHKNKYKLTLHLKYMFVLLIMGWWNREESKLKKAVLQLVLLQILVILIITVIINSANTINCEINCIS